MDLISEITKTYKSPNSNVILFNTFSVLLSIILALLVCGTLFDLLVIQRPKWAAQDQGDDCVDSGLENAFSAQSRFNYLSIPDVERTIEEEVTSRDQAPMNGDSLRSREELYNTSGTVLLKEDEPLLRKAKIEPKASTCYGKTFRYSWGIFKVIHKANQSIVYSQWKCRQLLCH